MPKKRKRFTFREQPTGEIWMYGIFHELREAGKEKPPFLQLCTQEDYIFKKNKKGELKERSTIDKAVYQNELYNLKKTEIQLKRDRQPIFKKTESEIKKFSEIQERYIKRIASKKSSGHYQNIKCYLRWWNTKIGKLTLSEITTSVIVEYMEELEDEGKSNSTVNRYVACLKSVLFCCIEKWEVDGYTKAPKVDRLNEPTGRTRYLLTEELEPFKDACRAVSEDLYLAVILSLATGGRKMEIWDVIWKPKTTPDPEIATKGWIDLSTEQITFAKTKNGKMRTLPLKGEALNLLKKRVRRLDTLQLFPSIKNPNNYFDFRKQFYKAVNNTVLVNDTGEEELGLKNFNWHTMRHTFASYHAIKGTSETKLMELLGHSSTKMVARYSHLSRSSLDVAVENMIEEYGL